ncbi:hypothetical protein DFS34DRAFT_467087 [Phlyctochytrium arcticum]|nr:hypothetical protein DFS34DRAFT_467087 [Phlyctochytrium arcticum]
MRWRGDFPAMTLLIWIFDLASVLAQLGSVRCCPTRQPLAEKVWPFYALCRDSFCISFIVVVVKKKKLWDLLVVQLGQGLVVDVVRFSHFLNAKWGKSDTPRHWLPKCNPEFVIANSVEIPRRLLELLSGDVVALSRFLTARDRKIP